MSFIMLPHRSAPGRGFQAAFHEHHEGYTFIVTSSSERIEEHGNVAHHHCRWFHYYAGAGPHGDPLLAAMGVEHLVYAGSACLN